MATEDDKAKPTDDEDECVVHTHPVPPEMLGRYSPIRDGAAEQDIENYVSGQAPDELVQHVERIKTEVVLGDKYEIWDVTTDKDRWWVITNLTNLYSQRHFPSLDYTLSFHIGLMMRLRTRSGPTDADEPDPLDEVFRRQEQASERFYNAVEAEDYQSVGMHLRECLLALTKVMRRRIHISEIAELPQAGNFKAWAEIIINKLCAGGSNDELRRFLRNASNDAWQLTNWLTHHTNATAVTAGVACDAVSALVGHFAHLLRVSASGGIETCPRCSSRHIRSHFDLNIEPDGECYATCGACGWTNHPNHSDDHAHAAQQ